MTSLGFDTKWPRTVESYLRVVTFRVVSDPKAQVRVSLKRQDYAVFSTKTTFHYVTRCGVTIAGN